MARAAGGTATLAHDDGELVARVQAGDEDAFGALVDRYFPSMVQVALGSVLDRTDAECVVHTTWLAVIDAIAGFDRRCSFRAWLFRMLVDSARAWTGTSDRPIRPDRPVGEVAEVAEVAEVGEVAEGRVPADGLRSVIWWAIDELPGSQRQVVVLRDVEGLPASEVSELLALTEADQRALLHRARAHVVSTLVPYLATGGDPARTS
jgi:RNA polymerase sigma-70 factor (ECF subfamily)